MSLEERYNVGLLRNEAEALVLEELEVQLGGVGSEMELTEESVLDMAAYALNRVRPLYSANLLGRIDVGAEAEAEERREEIRRAVRDAIRTVGENPAE